MKLSLLLSIILFRKCLSRQLRRVTPKCYPARGVEIIRRRWTAVVCRPMRLSRPAAAPMGTVEVGRRSKAWVVRERPPGIVVVP